MKNLSSFFTIFICSVSIIALTSFKPYSSTTDLEMTIGGGSATVFLSTSDNGTLYNGTTSGGLVQTFNNVSGTVTFKVTYSDNVFNYEAEGYDKNGTLLDYDAVCGAKELSISFNLVTSDDENYVTSNPGGVCN